MPSRPADHREVYGAAPEQFGELRLPCGGGPHSVVVLIHGGCWRAEYDITHVAPLATALADAGWAVWAIEYRRIGSPGGGWPGTFDDVTNAIAHVRQLAARHPLDLARVVVAGHSAGGHLALWSAAQESFLPRAVVSIAGITDLATYAAPTGCGSAVVPLLGGTVGEVPERYAFASPATTPPRVPVQAIIGTADAIVPHAQVDALARSTGARVIVRPVEGAGHFDLVAPDGDAWTALLQALRAVTG